MTPDEISSPAPWRAFAFEARLEFVPGTDTRAPGGAVTVALCGSWDHEGPCRWPHRSDLDATCVPARLRTVVVTDRDSESEVVGLIEGALRADPRWSVSTCFRSEIAPGEQAFAERLMHVVRPEKAE